MSRWTKHKRLAQLASAMCDQTITAEEVAELDQMLAADDAACEFYVDLLGLEADLPWTIGAMKEGQALHDQLQLPAEAQEPAAHVSPVASQLSRSTWAHYLTQHHVSVGMVAGLMFVVAVLAWAAVTYLPGVATKDEKSDDKAKHVALLSGRDKVAWLDGTGPAMHRRRLVPGQRLAFESGSIEIKYLTGARVVIEGPAEFTVGTKAEGTKAEGTGAQRKNNSGYLALGKLTARVDTDSAKGFTVRTPTGFVEDLGTEFAIDVDREGEANVYVRKGRVRANFSASNDQAARTVELVGGESMQLDADGVVAKSPTALLARFGVLDLKWDSTGIRHIAGVGVQAVSSELVAGPHHRAASHVVDGSGLVGNRHVNVPPDGTMWLTTGAYTEPHTKLPAHIVFDLGGHYDLARLHVWNYNESIKGLTSRGAKEVEISVSASDDATSFKKLVPESGTGAFIFPRADGTADYRGFAVELAREANAAALQNVRYVRFDIKSPYGGNPAEPSDVVGLSEVQFFGAVVKNEPNAAVESDRKLQITQSVGRNKQRAVSADP